MSGCGCNGGGSCSCGPSCKCCKKVFDETNMDTPMEVTVAGNTCKCGSEPCRCGAEASSQNTCKCGANCNCNPCNC